LFCVGRNSVVVLHHLVELLAALLAASLEKLNAREKELQDSKGFVESKRAERLKEVLQLEDGLKAERTCSSCGARLFALMFKRWRRRFFCR
jgi:hypothetical protein